jgi:hypothetical protein
MASKNWKRALLGVKVETTPGTYAAPAIATDYLLAEDVSIDFNIDKNERNPVAASLDPWPHTKGRKWVTVKFKTEIRGNARGTSWAPLAGLFKSMGMFETVTGGVSCIYTPLSTPATGMLTPGNPVSICIWHDGRNYAIPGCVGASLSSSASALELGYHTFTLWGMWPTVTDVVTPPAATIVTGAYVSGYASLFTVWGVTASMWTKKFDGTVTNTIVPRWNIAATTGYDGWLITDRKGTITADIEVETVAVRDWTNNLGLNTVAGTEIVYGTTSGSITDFAANTQITEYKEVNREGIYAAELSLAMVRSSGDDMFTITIT